MEMAAVGLHRVLAVGNTAQEGKADIEDWDTEDEERHGKGDNGIHLEQARNGKRGKNIAEKGRAGVAHENFRRVHVIRDKAEACAEERTEDDGDVGLLHHERHDDQGRGRDGRHTDGEAVEAVDKIDGVGDSDDPDDGDGDGQPAEIEIGCLGKDVGVGDKLNCAAVPDSDACGGNLDKQLRQRLERHDIVQNAENNDHDGAEQNALHLPVDVRKDENRQ